MPITTVTLNSSKLSAFLDIIEQNSAYQTATDLYRGQSNSAWPVTPGLYRITKTVGQRTQSTYKELERRILQDFYDQAIEYLPSWFDGSRFHKLVLAQHYGVPTRLLDWSTNPLVALFFAVRSQNDTQDAAVYFYRPNSGHTNERAIAEINGTNWHNYPNHASGIQSVKPPSIDRRINAQGSVFTFQSFGSNTDCFESLEARYFEETHSTIPDSFNMVSPFGKIVVPARIKAPIRSNLRAFGIMDSTLFPGLEGLASEIKNYYSLGSFEIHTK